ncbi:sodium-independent sulfate anion transporter-like [Periplaneta americana]|uniref:sodium-independent sulfate anion transporter-like n=1 Tax=Periplaneta americana TaxID=6978 RepID=UPI0037E6F80A
MSRRRISAHKMASDASGRHNAAAIGEEEAMATYYMMEYDHDHRDEDNANHHAATNGHHHLQKGYPKGGSSQSVLVGNDDNSGSRIQDATNWIREKARKSFTKKVLYKRLPVLSWLPRYNGQDAVGDLVAGITVGLTVIPQSLAYANIAGVPTQYGLYGSFLGCFLYIIFGSCKDVPMGPTAIVSLLTFQQVQNLGEVAFYYAILLCFFVGCVELLMGILGLGFVIDFISGPVSSGFTSAAALIIVTSQVKDVMGISASGNTFIKNWDSLFRAMDNTRLWDTVLGVSCIVVLLLMRLLTMVNVGPKDDMEKTSTHRIINKTLWLIGTSRNAILVIVCGFIGYWLDNTDTILLTGSIPAGLPDIKVPPFGFNNGNQTATFTEMTSTLGTGIIILPLVALLEDIAICKAFSNGKPVDATQELLAMGICNIGNSFVQGFPGSGSLSRSAVNNSSGARTPLGGLYTGLLVMLSLLFLTPLFYYIPKSALGAMIIAAVIFMVEVHVVIPMWKTKKSDLIPGIGTFVACLALPLEIGILVGIGINILFILYHAARPKIAIENQVTPEGVEYLLLTPDRCLIFPSVDYVRNLVTKHSIKQAIPVVIDCSHIYGADFTAAKVIECITQDFTARKQPLFFYNLKPSIVAIFNGLQPKDFVVYYSEHELDNLIRAHKKLTEESKLKTDISIITTG